MNKNSFMLLLTFLMSVFFLENAVASNYDDYEEEECERIVNAIERKGSYEWISSLSCGEPLIGVIKNQKYGFVNTNGDIVIPVIYENATFFNADNHLLGVKKHGKWGFINHKNKVVIPFQYDDVYCLQEGCDGFFNGLVSVQKNGKWGVVNTKNQIIIPFEYDEIGSSQELWGRNVIRVSKNDKWGVVDKSNRVIIPLQHKWIDTEFKVD